MGFYQLINEPTHLLENSFSCIDLIFTSLPNLVVELGVHPSLHPNCHHQIVFAKYSLMISYPLPYSRNVWVWHYRESNTDLIRRAISKFNWKKPFYKTNFTKKVSIFNKTILNVLCNYIPRETLTLSAATPQNGQTRSNNSSVKANELFEYVWAFCGVEP